MTPPLPRTRFTRRTQRRWVRHLLLGSGGITAVALVAAAMDGETGERLSLATAYVGLVLLTVTLCLGPVNVLRRKPNPVSFDRRRDFGIWTAILGVVHTGLGLTVHFRGRMHLYFLAEGGAPGILGIRRDAFGAANHTGLIATALLLVLAAISNDVSLRRLGAARWGRLQRWATYTVVLLVLIHGGVYQLLENRTAPLVVGSAMLLGVMALMQFLGWRRTRLSGDSDSRAAHSVS